MDHTLIILQDLKNHLSQHFKDEILQVILFGSQAINTGSNGSDYDVLVILKSKHDWITKERIIDLCYDIDLKYSIFIDVHLLAQEELIELRGKQPIFLNAIQNGIRA
jgi:uncharacterized protein